MRKRLGRVIAVAAIAWPLLAGWSVWQRVSGSTSLTTVVPYVVGSVLCHQRPERSFRTAGVVWPVCARCAGLYFGAAFGGAWVLARWHRDSPALRSMLAASALPTAITFAIEWSGTVPVSNAARAAAGLPLGVTIAMALSAVTTGAWGRSGRLT
jgi:uncharacterized membrane protein